MLTVLVGWSCLALRAESEVAQQSVPCMAIFSTCIADKAVGLKLLWLLSASRLLSRGFSLLPAFKDSKVYSGNCLQLRPRWKWYSDNRQCSNEMNRGILSRERMGWSVLFGFVFPLLVIRGWALDATAPVPEFLDLPLFRMHSYIVWNNKNRDNHTSNYVWLPRFLVCLWFRFREMIHYSAWL